MAGSPFKDAWRTRLATHRTTLGYTTTWPIKDTDDTATQPGVPSPSEIGFLELEFPGGPPSALRYFGNPGNNLHHSPGQVTLRVVAPLRKNRDAAEVVAEAFAGKFLADRFTPVGATFGIRVTGLSPVSDGHDEGGNYVLSILIAYETYKVG
jgi:hypothetical protein